MRERDLRGGRRMEESRKPQGSSGLGGGGGGEAQSPQGGMMSRGGELEEGMDKEPKGWKSPKGERRGGMKGEASGMMGG